MKYNYNYRSIKVKEDTMDRVNFIISYMNSIGYSMNKGTCLNFITAHYAKLLKDKIKAQDHGNK